LYMVHQSAYVDEPCSIGEGTKVWHFSHIMRGATIGRGCTIGQNVLVGPNVRIGNNVKIQNNVSVYEGVELEDDVFCGPSMVFTNVVTPRSGTPRNTSADYVPTLVRRGATIGANATIVCGTTIGEFAFVGAGAVVTRDVPPYALVYGNPARVHGYACECGARLSFMDTIGSCESCGRLFRRSGGLVHQVLT
jgi:UDP-2-acetamido-3-amino-2,3-dideoxy-glucuronate N-acetyltransferase